MPEDRNRYGRFPEQLLKLAEMLSRTDFRLSVRSRK